MLNLLRSDFYRLFKSKAFYICTFVSMLLLAINIFILDWSVRTLGAENAMYATMPYKDGISYGIIAFSSGDVHLFISIFTAIFITGEFTHGTMKNAVSKGFSRLQIYFSKLITMTAASFLMIIVMFLTSTIAATIVLGTFGDITGTYMGQMLKVIGIELLLHTSLIAIFVMVAMTIRNIGGVIAINIIGVMSLSSLIYVVLGHIFKTDFMKYSLLNNIRFYNSNLTATGDDFLRSIIVGFAFFVIITAIGIFGFKKMDVK